MVNRVRNSQMKVSSRLYDSHRKTLCPRSPRLLHLRRHRKAFVYRCISQFGWGVVISTVTVSLGRRELTYELIHSLILSLQVVYTQTMDNVCVSAITCN